MAGVDDVDGVAAHPGASASAAFTTSAHLVVETLSLPDVIVVNKQLQLESRV